MPAGFPLSRFRLHCGERFRYEYDFTADWNLDIRLEKVLPFDPRCPIPLCTAGRGARHPNIAAELAIIWNAWTGTDIRSRRWPSWLRPCSGSLILEEIVRPSAISMNCVKRWSEWRRMRTSSRSGLSDDK